MSRLAKRGKSQGALSQITQQLRSVMADRGNTFADKSQTEKVLGLEGLADDVYANFEPSLEEMRSTLKGIYEPAYKDMKIGLESFTPQQWEAGALTAMAFGDAGAYHAKASRMQPTVSSENLQVIEPGVYGPHGDMNYMSKPSMEAFDERELKAFMNYSIVFNVNAARQDEFGEAFYPTIVVSPDQAGLDVTVRRPMVMNEVRHALTGKAMDFKRVNLVDAAVEPTILATDSTVIYPERISGGANDNVANFASGITFNVTTNDGVVVASAPLKPAVNIDLLGLGQRTDLQTTGQFDNTDSLDSRMYLTNLYLSVTSATAATATSDFIFDVSRLPRNQFLKTTEGLDRDTQLTFVTIDLPISSTKLDVAGVAAASSSLAYLTTGGRTNWVVRLAINVTGIANHELGNINVNPASATIDSVWDMTNPSTPVQITGTDLTNLKADFTAITLKGYDVYAARSNLNRRTRGLQVTSLELTERFTIPLLSPITTPSPINSNRDASDLAALITAARIRNSNNAVTQLLNYADTLSSYALSQDRRMPVPNIEGTGRYLVRPYYDEETINVFDVVNSIKSQDRMADVRAALVNKIRDHIYKAYRLSGYQPALDNYTGTIGDKPQVLIGTDSEIAKYLMVDGDNRTMGIMFDTRVVMSQDRRVYGKIFVTFTRPNQGGPDPLSFGNMAWMPELAGTVQLTRNGATIKETMVQPRVRHINYLPILIVLTLENLSEAVADKTSIDFNNV